MKKARAGDRKSWEGGYARHDGRAWVYYLATRRPRRIEKSTGAHSEELARLHLDAFRRNPEAYDPRNVRAGRPPLPLTEELCCEFLDYLAAPQSAGGKGDSRGHAATAKSALKWWLARLGNGRDLRALSESEIRLPVSSEMRGRHHKLATLKTFVGWLRRVRADGLARDEGPDERAVVVPQTGNLKSPKLAAEREEKGARAWRGYFAVVGLLPPRYRAALTVQAGTGWHVSEVARWLELGGTIEHLPEGREQDGAAVLMTFHKRGGVHRQAVSRKTLEAAVELREFTQRDLAEGRTHAGYDFAEKRSRLWPVTAFPRKQYAKEVARACEKAGVARFSPGAMRHAVATFARSRGLSNEQVGAGIGHVGGRMVERHYADPAAQIGAVRELPSVAVGLPDGVAPAVRGDLVAPRIPTLA